MNKKEILKLSLSKAMPIVISYIFVSLAYGITMSSAGYHFLWSLGVSLFVYTGAFQFVLVTFLASGASFLTIGLTALFMNSRQTFYGLTFIKDFNSMKKRKWYMIHTLTDETYAVNCTLNPKEYADEDRKDIMFYTALFSRISWMTGTVLGGILGQVIPFDTTGIDFCMTALFVTIFIDQWRATNNHIPAFLGLGCAVVFLFLLGPSNFILPSLCMASGLLLFVRKKDGYVDGTTGS